MAITGKAAEDILERIFQPTTKPSARDQAEETLRHPKRLVYVAMSNKSFYWRAHIQKFVLDSGLVPVSPFMLFDYYLMHTVDKNVVREAMNNLLSRSDPVDEVVRRSFLRRRVRDSAATGHQDHGGGDVRGQDRRIVPRTRVQTPVRDAGFGACSLDHVHQPAVKLHWSCESRFHRQLDSVLLLDDRVMRRD